MLERSELLKSKHFLSFILFIDFFLKAKSQSVSQQGITARTKLCSASKTKLTMLNCLMWSVQNVTWLFTHDDSLSGAASTLCNQGGAP